MSKEKILNAARQLIRTAALLASAVCGPTAAADTAGSTPTLAILPQSGLADEPVRIRLSGLGAGQMALVTATMQDDRGTLWVSSAEFKATDDGVIDNSSDAPTRGSYEGADVTGLVWSMTPQVPKGMESTPYFKDPLGSTTIRITASLLAQRATTVVRDQTAVSLLAQQATTLVPGQTSVLDSTAVRMRVAPGVRRQIVRQDGVVGEYFAPSGPGPFPAVITVGGSSGGLSPQPSAMLASRGFASLSVAYFRYEGVPQEMVRIPLEYFDKALVWLGNQPGVDRERLGFLGASRGGELTLLAASYLPRIKAAVAIVPSHVMWGNAGGGDVPMASQPSWSFKGRDLPFMRVPPPKSAAEATSELFLNYLRTRPDLVREATIPLDRSRAQILLVSGSTDETWPSREFSEAMVEHMQRAGKGSQVKHLMYAESGHWTVRSQILPTTILAAPGGTTALGSAKAQAEAWPAVLRFLEEKLAPLPPKR